MTISQHLTDVLDLINGHLATAQVAEHHTVRAVADVRDINLPGVLVAPATFTLDRLDPAQHTATWDVYLIARDTGPQSSLTVLGTLLDHLAGLGVGEARAQTLSLPGIGDMPTLHLNITTTTT